MKKIFTVGLMLWSAYFLGMQGGYAQAKIYKSSLAPVAESGYYNIELDTRLVGSAKANLSNLRIYQQKEGERSEVPYFIKAVQPTANETKVIDYLVLNSVEKDSINRFTIHNPEKRKITDFYIAINKADVAISALVRGSNNKQDWFIVKQKTPIYTYASSAQEETLFLSIPEGSYEYYDVELVNNQTTPLKLNRVTTVVGTKTYGQFSLTKLQYNTSETNQKDKTTVVSFVQQDLNYKINKLILDIKSPRDYYRKAVLRDSVTKVALSFTLSSKHHNELILDDVWVRNPYLEIYNGNNTPLEIQALKVYSLTRFATAYLEANQPYFLEVNDSKKESPEYDIEHFKNEISQTLPIVQTADFSQIDTTILPNEDQKQKDKINWILWGVLITVGLVIGYICYKTFKNLEK